MDTASEPPAAAPPAAAVDSSSSIFSAPPPLSPHAANRVRYFSDYHCFDKITTSDEAKSTGSGYNNISSKSHTLLRNYSSLYTNDFDNNINLNYKMHLCHILHLLKNINKIYKKIDF